MRVYKIKYGKEWQPRITQGVQTFDFGYRGNEVEAAFMVRMFKKALKNHDAEKEKKWVARSQKNS